MKEINLTTEGSYIERSELRKARERAMVFLSYSDYTEKAMREKLLGCGFDAEAADHAVSYLIDRKYIDEPRYLAALCRYLAEKKHYGRAKIVASLRTRGFSSDVLSKHLDEALEDFYFPEICLYHIEKVKNLDLSDKKHRDKLIASLARKGFSLSEVKEAITLYNESSDNENN